MSAVASVLPLSDLAGTRHPGVSSGVGASYLEAVRVCLDRHHSPPVPFSLFREADSRDVMVVWDATDDLLRGAWANSTDATEAGAYACAIAAVDLSEGMVAVRRAETGTGADYYVAPPGGGVDDLEDCFRLEVSGVDARGEREVERRLKDKVKQAANGASCLPALACVVGFRARVIKLRYVRESS